jgi:predicted phosphoribosyltransferase
MFRDRYDAASQLAEALQKYDGVHPLVLGIPRGGVVIGSILARELGGDLDVILTRKLRTPGHPELAMGSVDENGNVFLNVSVVHSLGIDEATIEQERQRQMRVIGERAESYRHIYPRIPLKGRVVIVTDDGIATGATMRVAIQMARDAEPESLVVGLPVGPPEEVKELKKEVDDMVCLLAPPGFEAVGQFYELFNQVEDDEVEEILREFAERRS